MVMDCGQILECAAARVAPPYAPGLAAAHELWDGGGAAWRGWPRWAVPRVNGAVTRMSLGVGSSNGSR